MINKEGRGAFGGALTRAGVALLAAGAGAAVGAVLGRARLVGVSGPSMSPTLSHGDAVLAFPVREVRPGDVVIARFRARPELLVVKRAIRSVHGGWWLRGDNPLVTDDSRRYGPADVLGVVYCRYWPKLSRRLLRTLPGS